AGRGAPPAEETVEVVRWGALDELVERHSAVLRTLRAALAGDGHIGAIDSWSSDPGGGPEHAVSGTWVSDGTPLTREIVVDRAYRDQVRQVWQPLDSVPLPDAGIGPLLAGTEGSRTETDTGVRIAQLPDRPR
ncbi:MAG: hypothetical protein QOI75_4191, partial [Pseudonocardiales bacterium]|nr:hypothetical protein [Pseudonocardiales bacterium]